MIGGCYAARGWTEDGLVSEEKARELGLVVLLAVAFLVNATLSWQERVAVS